MAPRRDSDERPAPGIYETGGTKDGHPVLIAYDYDGECEFAHGETASYDLEKWLRSRGVRLATFRPGLVLLRGLCLCFGDLLEVGMRLN